MTRISTSAWTALVTGLGLLASTAAGQDCAGDMNGDGVVDLADFGALVTCFSGPEVPVGAGCDPADLDGDGDSDLVDFAAFQLQFGVNCNPPQEIVLRDSIGSLLPSTVAQEEWEWGFH